MKGKDRGQRRLRFTQKVMLYLLSAYVLMAVLFGGMYYVNARDSTENRVIQEIAHSLERTHSEVQELITQTENVYLDLILDEELYTILVSYEPGVTSRPRTAKRISPILKSAVRNLDGIKNVQLLSEDYVFYTQNSTYTSTLNVSNSAIFQRARENSQPFWTTLYDFTVEYGHTALEDAALPIPNRNLISYVGQFNGFRQNQNVLEMWPSRLEKPVIFINIDEAELRSMLSDTVGRYDGECFIVEASGAFVSHTDGMQLYGSMDEDAFEMLSRQKQDSGVLSLEYNGRDSMVHYTRLSNGWTLVSVISRNEVFSEIYSIIGTTLTGMLLGTLALGVVLSLLISHSLSLPIRQLLEAINITGGGNFMVNLPRTGDEFDAVNTAFNSMAQRIETLIHENYEVKLRERENELRALKYQTKPHFLYNALSIIRAAALRNGDEEVAKMVLNLSNVLRYVLRGDQNLATVREEMNNVMDYFELMRAGYDDAISLEVDMEPAVLNAAICKMTLQPLVENCVQHGMANLPQSGVVRIAGKIQGSSVSLTISDNGSGWPEDFRISDDEHQTESIGLANVRRRMKLTFGEQCEFRLFTSEEGGAAVELIFPYQFGATSIMEK